MTFVAETLNVNGAYLTKLFGLQVRVAAGLVFPNS